ncbi:MAG TPA: hypothetical protein EYQ25_10865 [Planctomycetes bacterium]|nr:hypothetical protein [Planctomycetota bacterium]HIL37104.1 hypothetical protein [Planctomycetota bacterium]
MPHTPQQLSAYLTEQTGLTVRVTLTRAMSQPVRGQSKGAQWDLRLHRAFAQAPEDVLENLARWLRNGRRSKRACEGLDQWLEETIYSQRIQRRTPLRSGQGETYDLIELAQDLWEGFLESSLSPDKRPHLEWGLRRASRSRGGLRLGSWDAQTNRVRLHPVLDDPGVPAWFVRTVLVHELLHAAHPPIRDQAGRRCPHHSEFRQRERSWPDHEKARAYERKHLPRLVRAARSLARIR